MRQHDLEVEIIRLNDKINMATGRINRLIGNGINDDEAAKKELKEALEERTRLQMEATKLYDTLYFETEYAKEWKEEREEWLKTVESLKKQEEETDITPYVNVKLGLRRIDKDGNIIRDEGERYDVLCGMIRLCGDYESHAYFTHLGDGWFLRMTHSLFLQLARIDNSKILYGVTYSPMRGIRIKDGKIYSGVFAEGKPFPKDKDYVVIDVDNDEVIEVFKEEFKKGLNILFRNWEAKEVKDTSFGEGFDIIEHSFKVEDYEFRMNNFGKYRDIIIPNDL